MDVIVGRSYSAPHRASAGVILQYDAVCRDTLSDGLVTATTANLAAAGGFVAGIALTASSDGSPILYQTRNTGIVPNVLGVGAAGLVSVNSAGRLERGTAGSGGIIAECDDVGNIYPLSAERLAAVLGTSGDGVDIRAFGALCNGVADDRVAINATLDFLGGSGKMRIPGVTRFTSGNVTIPSGVTTVFSVGGRFLVGAGRTLTLGGPIEANERQWIFDYDNESTSIVTRAAGYSQRMSVMWFGAKGDNTQTDTIYIQRAFGVKGQLYLPSGTYKVTSQLNISADTTLVGESRDISVIKQAGITVNAGALVNPFFLIRNATAETRKNIHFRSLGFVGDNDPFFQPILADQNLCMAIRISGGADCSVDDCRFENLYGFILRTEGTESRIHFLNTVCRQCGGELNINADGCIIANSYFEKCWAIESAQQRTVIINNILKDCDSGISIGGSGGRESYQREDLGVTITTTTGAGVPIVITCPSHGLLEGNTVRISGVVGNTAANGTYFVGATVTSNTFNIVTNSGGTAVIGNGAYVSGGQIYQPAEFSCIVANNLIDGTTGGGGIQIGQPQVGTLVIGNTIRRTTNVGIAVNSLSYYAPNPRLIRIENNTIESIIGHGIWIYGGDSHQVINNTILQGKLLDQTSANTLYGILIQDIQGDVSDIIVRGNRSSGSIKAFLLDGVTRCRFTDNIGDLRIENSWGEAVFLEFRHDGSVELLGSSTPTFGDQYTGGRTAGLSLTKPARPKITTRKHTCSYTVFRDTGGGAGSATLTVERLPVGCKVLNVICKTTTPFAGPAGTISLVVGYAGGNEYILTHDVKTAAITRGTVDGDLGAELARASTVQGGGMATFSTQRDVSTTMTLGAGTCSQLTSGSVDIYLTVEQILDYVQPP